MHVNEQTQAILLLTAWFDRKQEGIAEPLKPTEWGQFAEHLYKTIKATPADLLGVQDYGFLFKESKGFNGKKITPERIRSLMGRSAALAIALERWQRAGLWILTRADKEYYPRLWKDRLNQNAPPVLFGAGDRSLLNRGGIAVVGSRNLDETQLMFTDQLGRNIALQGKLVVSGGARGADEASMLGALNAGGQAVGVLADSLMRASTSSKYRDALMRGDLALISTFNPEAGFNTGNAMARNKYIYCLSEAAIVISATEKKGGTWNGAVENLKHLWVPLWVKRDDIAGNKALVEKGGKWLPEDFRVSELVSGAAQDANVPQPAVEQDATYKLKDANDVAISATPIVAEPAVSIADASDRPKVREVDASEKDSIVGPEVDSYEAFVANLVTALTGVELSWDDLNKRFGVKKGLPRKFLARARGESVVIKFKRNSKTFYSLIRESQDGENIPPFIDHGDQGNEKKNKRKCTRGSKVKNNKQAVNDRQQKLDI